MEVACRDRWTNDVHKDVETAATTRSNEENIAAAAFASSKHAAVGGFVGGWRAKAVRYVPRPIGGRAGADVYGSAFHSVHTRDLRMMTEVGVNTVVIEQPATTSSLHDFLDVVQERGLCVIVEFGLWSQYWPRAEGGYVEAYDSFRTLFETFLQVRRPLPQLNFFVCALNPSEETVEKLFFPHN